MKSGNCHYSRRAFLKKSGLLGLGTMAAPLLPSENAEAFLFNKKEFKISKTRLDMGTFVSMTAIHPSKDQAEDAFGRTFEEVSRLSSLLSRHAQSSPVAELNRTGVLKDAPGEVIDVISRSLHFYNFTSGAFDITVKPLLDLYQSSFESGQQPDSRKIEGILSVIDGKSVIVDGDAVFFSRDKMGVTLDGIAKGYIVDKASELLYGLGVKNHLINAGGDIRTSGTAAKGKKWKIAIQDPNKAGHYPDVISMSGGSVATSGNYEIFYDQERVFHHIVNSRTGFSPQLSASVSITAPTVTEADALSTAVFVLEPENGVAFINACPGYECLVIERDSETSKSLNWG